MDVNELLDIKAIPPAVVNCGKDIDVKLLPIRVKPATPMVVNCGNPNVFKLVLTIRKLDALISCGNVRDVNAPGANVIFPAVVSWDNIKEVNVLGAVSEKFPTVVSSGMLKLANVLLLVPVVNVISSALVN